MVVAISEPNEGFDFEWESTIAAVNEACAGEIEDCCITQLCPECTALAELIKSRLIRAYEAGRASTRPAGSNLDTGVDIPGGGAA